MPEKVILDPYFRKTSVLFPPEQLARLRSFAEVVGARDEQMSEAEIEANAADAVAIVTGSWRYGSVDRFPRLRAIIEVGGSFPSPEKLDYEACFRRGIRVLSAAPAFAPAVAEMALGLAIASARDVVALDAAFRVGEEEWGHRGGFDDFLLFDKPVGFIGFGSIARTLKGLLAPFRCPVKVYDPWLTDAWLRLQGVTPAPLDDLLETSRVLFVLATPSASNKALLDRAKLERIPHGAVVVLISRSHLVDFDVFTEMVLADRFKAAVDVFPTEPLPKDHPIRQARGAILTPHRAGGGPDSYHLMGRMVVNDLEAILTGRAPQELQVAQPEYIRSRG